MTRILVDARLGWGSGIGRYVSNVLPRVADLLPQHQFDTLVYEDDFARATDALANVGNAKVMASSMPAFSLKEQYALSGIASGYDMTWFTNYWVPLAWNKKCLVSVHDLLHLEPEIFPASSVKRTLSRLVFGKVARSADAISFLSRFTQREFERRFGAVSVSDVHYCGIDHAELPMFDPAQPPAKHKSLLVVGASKMHKNFDTLLKAWSEAKVGEDWTLTIISPDDKLRSSIDLESIVAGAARTKVLKGISNQDLHDLYAQAAIMLTPSMYEGFGLPFMEAMSAGAYCISSTAEAMVEVGEGAWVRYVNPRDVQGWTLAIEETCRAMDLEGFDFAGVRRHNMAHARTFQWQRVAETTAGLIARIS